MITFFNISAAMPSFLTTDRIVGGADASAVIPWQVSVRSSGSHFCGGTVLDSQTVLCAAHCFTSGQSMDGITIKVGDIDRTTGGQVLLKVPNKPMLYLFWVDFQPEWFY